LINIKKFASKFPTVRKLVKNYSLKEAHDYWTNPHGDNRPESYFQGEKRSEFLVKLFNKHVENMDATILELGCNVGRNLNFLYNKGYRNLTGVEINPAALQLMRTKFPEMSSNITLFNSSIESKIKEFNDKKFDVVFTMAVMMHIPYESNWIFEQIARITNKVLVTIENENDFAKKNFLRNYQLIFEKLGMTQIDYLIPKDMELNGYVARIFKTN
jgi:SAM-dependent methyltransferase